VKERNTPRPLVIRVTKDVAISLHNLAVLYSNLATLPKNKGEYPSAEALMPRVFGRFRPVSLSYHLTNVRFAPILLVGRRFPRNAVPKGTRMRLVGQVHVRFPGEVVYREPKFWEKLKQRLGGSPNLAMDRVRVAVEASALVDTIKRALVRLGFDNALSLVVDDTVIFQDTESKTGDLPDLMLAISEHTSLFGSSFRELRLALEHEEAGLHLLVETRAFTEHATEDPSAYVSVGGRIQELEPKRDESAEEYRKRVMPIASDGARLECARLQFEEFMGRLENALRIAMPEAKIEQKHAEAQVLNPSAKQPEREQEKELPPSNPAYDPYTRYYPSPMGMMLDVMLISSFMHMMRVPAIHVMHPSGASIGSAADVAQNPDMAMANASDISDTSDVGDLDQGGDFGNDGDDFDGGDFDGGDFSDF